MMGTGDQGMTSLSSGELVPKSHARIEACGDVDELCSVLGALAAFLPITQTALRQEIQAIQGELLHIGAELAASPGSPAAGMLRKPDPGPLAVIERAIERMDAALPRLQSFILPGGHPAAAWAHVARTVCRRAERRVSSVEPGDSAAGALPYLNRLSTYLYAFARTCNQREGVPEAPWKG